LENSLLLTNIPIKVNEGKKVLLNEVEVLRIYLWGRNVILG
jgi:hypothetical protein